MQFLEPAKQVKTVCHMYIESAMFIMLQNCFKFEFIKRSECEKGRFSPKLA